VDTLAVIAPPLKTETTGANKQIGQFETADSVNMLSGRINWAGVMLGDFVCGVWCLAF